MNKLLGHIKPVALASGRGGDEFAEQAKFPPGRWEKRLVDDVIGKEDLGWCSNATAKVSDLSFFEPARWAYSVNDLAGDDRGGPRKADR